MTRPLLRLSAIFWLLYAGMMFGAVFIGRLIPTGPLAIAFTYQSSSSFLITWLDSGYQRPMTGDSLQLVVDDDCRLIYAPIDHIQQRLALLNLKTGQTRAYLPEFSKLNSASWLPDKRRLWVNLNDTQGVTRYMLLDTITGAVVPIDMPAPGFADGVVMLPAPDSQHGLIQNVFGIFAAIVTTATGEIVPLNVSALHQFSWSPDSRLLAVQDVYRHSVTVMDLTGNVQYQHEFAALPDLRPLWLSNDTLIIVGRNATTDPFFTGYHWSLANNTLEATPLHLAVSRTNPADWSPDGTRLYQSMNGETSLYDVATGTLLMQNNFASESAAWSPDSRYLVEYPSNSTGTRSGDEGTFLINDTLIRTASRFPVAAFRLKGQWSPDSRHLAVFSPGSEVALVTLNPDGIQFEQRQTDVFAYSINLCYDEVPA